MLPTTPETSKTLQPVTVFAALGPNPAPLAELLWALHRQRGLRPTALFLVVDSRGHDFLQRELLSPGAVLHELALLLDLTLPPDAIHLRVVTGPGGAVLDDDDPGHADLYNAAIWDMARAATLQAGDDVVVFGLTAGRRRTMTAMSTMAFQLLARAWDLCLDVRVSDKRAEGGVGFYFPEQQQRDIVAKNGDLRGVDPGAADPNADDAGWFDAKISRLNAARIEKAKIWEYATTRYKRLFDGIVER